VSDTKHIEAGERAEFRRAELEFQEAAVEERRAEANLEKLTVRAPVDGIAVAAQTFRGSEFSQLRAGDQVRPGQLFMQIVDPRSMIVEAAANQVDVESVRIGAQAHVRFDAFPDLEISARVCSIGALARSTGWRGSYLTEVPVFLKLDRTDPRLVPNLTVSADVIVGRRENANIVPREAVVFDPRDRQPYAFVRTSTGWEQRELELGLENHVDIAVRSGLRPGESVAVNGPPA
jgi:multidrug efflux pump subunit AcrA (membrane-fusion protein)